MRGYCSNDKTENVIKRSGKWYISVDETKSLRECDIKQCINLFDLLEKHSEYNVNLEEYGIAQENLEIIHKYISVRKLDYIPKRKKKHIIIGRIVPITRKDV